VLNRHVVLLHLDTLDGDALLSFVEESGALGKLNQEEWSNDSCGDGGKTFYNEDLKSGSVDIFTLVINKQHDLPIASPVDTVRRQHG
jgi:hypothetical protein